MIRSALTFLGIAIASSAGGCHACAAALLLADDEDAGEHVAAPQPAASPQPADVPEPSEAPAPEAQRAPAQPAKAAASPPAPRPVGSSAVDGRYECLQIRVLPGPGFTTRTTFVPGALPGFTITGASYTSSGREGSVSSAGKIVSFVGGPYGGWRAINGTDSTGFYLYFRGETPADPKPELGARNLDYQCYRQGK